MDQTAAGWHADPYRRFAQRYWDGTRWTEHVSDGSGTTMVDPSGADPSPPTAGTDPVGAPRGQQAGGYPPGEPGPPSHGAGAYGASPLGGPGAGWPPAGSGMPTAPARNTTPGLAIAALVLGIGALLFSFIPFIGFASVPFAIAGVVTGVMGMRRSGNGGGGGGKGMSIAGLVCGALALLVSIAYVVLFVVVADDIDSDRPDGICDPDRYFQDPDC